jgi:hypothetical protein
MTNAVTLTAPVTVARTGRLHLNHAGDVKHLDLASLAKLSETAAYCRNHPDSEIHIHLPPGGVWDGLPAGERELPWVIRNGERAAFYRRSDTLYQRTTFQAGGEASSMPPLSGHVVVAGQSITDALILHPNGLLDGLDPGVGLIDCAYGGSAIFASDTGANYWLETDLTPGPRLTDALAAISGRPVDAIIWGQAEADRNEIVAGTLTPAEWRAGVEAVWTALGWPAVPVIVQMPARIPLGAYADGYQALRETYQQMTGVRRFEAYDMETVDGTHPTPAAAETAGARAALLIQNPALDPVHVTAATAVLDARARHTATRLDFSGAVTWTDFQGLDGVVLTGVTWADDMQSVVLHHEPANAPVLRYPHGSGIGLGRLPYGSGADAGRFPLQSFSVTA